MPDTSMYPPRTVSLAHGEALIRRVLMEGADTACHSDCHRCDGGTSIDISKGRLEQGQKAAIDAVSTGSSRVPRHTLQLAVGVGVGVGLRVA